MRITVWLPVGVLALTLALSVNLHGQTSSTGALTGIVRDTSGAVFPEAVVTVTRQGGGETRSATSDEQGRFGFLLLPPGTYDLQATRDRFKTLTLSVTIRVTQTLQLEVNLRIAPLEETALVVSSATAEIEDSATGQLLDGKAIANLPLATRNYSQLLGLSPGVTSGVFNAGQLGIGGTALSQISKSNDGIYVHGSRSYQNEWTLDGISVSDIQGTGSSSGGIPIPNPDTIEEFKVQTGVYDAAFGRFSGANVSLITKRGTDEYHGTLFEYFRNNSLNANDFFLKQTGQPRPVLKQNQFGFAVGGPVVKGKARFFTSYQGTRQENGSAAGQARIACTAVLKSPPITNDRSSAALGTLFGGMTGSLGGLAVALDGSNINPVALRLLNLRLPDGSFLIPTPQSIDPGKPFAAQGQSAFSQPCQFDENQFLGNVDYTISPRDQIASRLFIEPSNQTVTFPGGGFIAAGNVPGFASPANSDFVVWSLTHVHTFDAARQNELRIGYVRTRTATEAKAPFQWSDIGVLAADMNLSNSLPSLSILGSVNLSPSFPRTYAQNSYSAYDVFSILKGPHSFRMGGSLTRIQDYLHVPGVGSFVQFLGWPDFLLGLNASENGTQTFSNIFTSSTLYGLLDRSYATWEGSAFVQDDIRVAKTLTLNVGLRYDRFGQFADESGRNSAFDVAKADTNHSAGGSLAGYVVGSNFQYAIPPGVERSENPSATAESKKNTFAPRIGFAWNLPPGSGSFVLRGGYGIYYSRPTGQAFSVSLLAAPFASARPVSGAANAGATFQSPFRQPFPTPSSFPFFTPYAAGGSTSITTASQDFQPAVMQQFSLNLETLLRNDWQFKIGYAATRGNHLQRYRSLNQALEASPNNPVNGMTSNTIANVALRTPIPGVPADGLRELETDGESWYQGLEASGVKRFTHGFQFVSSYTFSKILDTDGADINGTSAANTLTLGDQNSPEQRWGRANFDRTHRFVFSLVTNLPTSRNGVANLILGTWRATLTGVIQSGNALTIAYTNSNNVFGISEDRAQLSGLCTKNQLVTSGPIGSKLDGYFNKACFTAPPVIGADGRGTDFGDSETGIANGPGQANLDAAVSNTRSLPWRDGSSVEFRAELFNALNHPQFGNPDANFSSPTFGAITSTSVNARVIQLALRFAF